jgi:hypothetical protein
MPSRGLSLVGFVDQPAAVNHLKYICTPANRDPAALIADRTAAQAGICRRSLAMLCVLSTVSTSALADETKHGAGQCDAGQIIYQSDTDDAYRYLEGQQRRIYAENPHLADAYAREELKNPRSVATVAELKARALKACPDSSSRAQCALDPDMVGRLMRGSCLVLPTRFEALRFTSSINLYTAELDKVRVSHFPQSPVTRFGSLPTGTFDAQALRATAGKPPLVILNRDIFVFTGALSKAVADAIPITRGEAISLDYSEWGIRTRLQDHPYIVHNFADAMSRLVRAGSSVGAVDVPLDESHGDIQAKLVAAINLFLISREESHVILGHVSDQSVAFHLAGIQIEESAVPGPKPTVVKNQLLSPSQNSPGDGPSTISRAELRTREQELQADALGFKLMIWSEKDAGDPVAVMVAAAAPHIVFRVLEAADSYGREAGGWTFGDVNHPSAADRIKALSPVFDEVARTTELLREADFRIPFDAAFNVLLAEADPQIRRHLALPPKKPQ